jgi:hypothetical protein
MPFKETHPSWPWSGVDTAYLGSKENVSFDPFNRKQSPSFTAQNIANPTTTANKGNTIQKVAEITSDPCISRRIMWINEHRIFSRNG